MLRWLVGYLLVVCWCDVSGIVVVAFFLQNRFFESLYLLSMTTSRCCGKTLFSTDGEILFLIGRILFSDLSAVG